MFDHSIKVPRLYKIASKIAEKHALGHGSIKTLTYEALHPNKKAIYSLVLTTFQHRKIIDDLFEKSELLINESRINEWLARILISELLWGKKRLTSDAKPIKTILAYEHIFKALIDDNSIDTIKYKQVDKPRYVRVNTLIIPTADIISKLRDEGWVLYRNFNHTYEEYLEKIKNLQSDEFTVDIHIPDVLVFAKRTVFYGTSAYNNGEIILQDKASCLPVYLLNPKPDSCVMDMCAAPGMKTTQIAALMENRGKIFAIELKQERFQTMNKLIGDLGATCIETINRDVTTITDNDCPNVEYILVDPSCSGSGITSRPEFNEDVNNYDKDRLEKLTGFQTVILRRALTIFPNVKRVVYSTCSIYPEENEVVVRDVLETCKHFKLIDLKQIMKDNWINYGSSEFGEIGTRCLYAKSDIDHTNGFFVAMFERLEENEHNEFFNRELYKAFTTKKKQTNVQIDDINNEDTSNRHEYNEKKKKKIKMKTNEIVDTNNSEENTEKIKKKKESIKSIDKYNKISEVENSEKTIETHIKKKKKKKTVMKPEQKMMDKTKLVISKMMIKKSKKKPTTTTKESSDKQTALKKVKTKRLKMKKNDC